MYKFKKWRIIFGIFISIILLLGYTIPVYAVDIDLPDVQIIDQIEVYRDALGEDDSQLWLIRYNCDYTTNTTTYDISEAFIFVLKDNTTNATISATTAYPYHDSGYDNGIISFEFDAISPPTWNGGYTLYFYGNPALSWVGGVPPTVQSSAITWHDDGNVADAQERLTTRLRYIAGQLETDWMVDLIESGATGTILTTYGEDYFTSSISNLHDICPSLFYQSMEAVEYEHDILITELLASGNDAAVSVNSTDYCAQTFVPSENYDITGVNIPAYRIGDPDILTLSLRATVGNLPAGANLVTGTYDTSNITTGTSGEWINIAFTSDYSLTAGATYAIVAITAVGGVNRFMWLDDTDNGYTNGQECIFTLGAWGAMPANDLLFEVEARNAVTMGLAKRVEDRLVGTQFDFTGWANSFGLSRIWWSTIFWVAISLVIMVAASFGSNSWDCSMVVLILMISYGWRGGWVDTILFGLLVALLSGGLIYGIFWKKT